VPARLPHPRRRLRRLRRAAAIGREAGLRYVYEGNVPGEKGENTYCPACRALLIERFGNMMIRNRIAAGRCPACRTVIDGVEMSFDAGQAAAAPLR
jgi:pyruvate formate lyase activating enzyme